MRAIARRQDSANNSHLAALAEIAENLHRREIGEIERAELVARWVALIEARAEVAQVAPLKKPGMGAGAKGGVRQAARDLGMTRDAVSRAVKVAGLSPEAKDAARAAGLADNQAALLAAAKAKTPEKQVEAIKTRSRNEAADAVADPRRLREAWTI